MKLTFSFWTAAATLALGLFSAPAAFAQSTWNLGGSSCNPGSGTANSAVCTVGGVQATITAWGNTDAGTSFVQRTLGENDPQGFGAIAPGSNEGGWNGHHGFDNKTSGCGSNGTTNTGCGGNQEFMLIGFNARVNLTALSLGFVNGDSDISIYRWDLGTNATTATGTAGAGWVLVASEDVDGNATGTVNTDNVTYTFGVNDSTATRNTSTSTDRYSSWWLISTYVGGSGANGLDASKNDAFKLSGFTAGVCTGTVASNGATCTPNGTPPGGAPEPGSLALAGLALAGVFAARRRPLATTSAA